MNSVVVAAITAALLAIPVDAVAQESQPAGATSAADPVAGKWEGTWDCAPGRCRSHGTMQMQLHVQAHHVIGQVRIPTSRECSSEWEKLAGEKKSGKVFATYDLGGRCRRTDVIFSIDPSGQVMTGTWSNQWPSDGTFKLTKTASGPPAVGAGSATMPEQK